MTVAMLGVAAGAAQPAQAASLGAPDSRGTDFWLAFISNYTNSGSELTLSIAAETAASGAVEVPGVGFSQPFAVAAGGLTTVTVPSAAVAGAANGQSIATEDLGIHVTANNEVSVYGLNRIQYTTDAFMGLPVDVLGTEYRIAAYPDLVYSEIGVVGTADGTKVTVLPTADLADGTSSGTPLVKVLNKGQTLFVPGAYGAADLTGSLVTSTAPVAVFGGTNCVNTPVGYGYCDHIVEQMTPTSTWGSQFVTVPLATRLGGDTFRMVANEDNTVVSVNGAVVATLAAGQFHERIIDGKARITSTKPILLTQYSNGTDFDGVTSDPFMVIIPPTEQFLAAYTFATPATGFSANFVNVVVPSAGVASLTLDGTPVTPGDFTAIPGTSFSGAQLPIDLGTHRLTGSTPFGITVYGFDAYDSYGYPGGLSLSRVAEATSLTMSPDSQSKAVGEQACLDATVLDQDGLPINGARVDFQVAGPNATTGFVFTGAAGTAQYCYSGANAGTDTVTASIASLKDTSTVNWTASTVPALSIDDRSIAEGNSGSKTLWFTVSLNGPSAEKVTVKYATADGTATSPSDFSAKSGTVTFNPGQTSKKVGITIQGDTTREPNETFTVNLSGAAKATIADPTGLGTIKNDDRNLV